jgi:putative oxidoreductase
MNTSVSASGTRLSSTSSVTLANSVEVAGRFLLSLIFLLSGLGKISAYAATGAYMAATGVPAPLLPVVISTEILGGVAIVLGYKTRIVAFLLTGFCLLTAIIFHRNLADQTQMIMFFKNLSIAGGFLLLVAITVERTRNSPNKTKCCGAALRPNTWTFPTLASACI